MFKNSRPRLHRWSYVVSLAMIVGAMGNARCASEPESLTTGDGDGLGGAGDDPRDQIDLDVGATYGGNGAIDRNLDPLCGAGTCVPDDEQACDPALGGAGGEGNMGGEGGISYDPGELDDRGAACRVAPAPDCGGASCPIERLCAPSGSSGPGEPCVAASDCDTGLACVGEGLSGICRPYCCRGSERSCEDGFFCEQRGLTSHPEYFVPVCMPVDDCPLQDPYPCPDDQDCACEDGRACVVVRSDGSTACTQPGSGTTGDPCTGEEGDECAHGYVCSPSAGCMKLCSTIEEDSGCPDGGTCQSPSGFPTSLGVCIGDESGAPAAK